MICLFLDGEPHLLLRNIKRDTEGNLKSGFVVNGLWNFEIRKGEMLCKSGSDIVTRRLTPNYYEMEIPDSVKGDYSVVMTWARKEYIKQIKYDTKDIDEPTL